jgi:ATP-dependent helicase/nuclease subunit A
MGPDAGTPHDAAARAFAVDPRHDVVLEASAGTGKTTVLVQRYLNLLRAGVDPANILAITFTRKAAAEMRDRVVAQLRREADLSPEGRARWRDLRDRLGDMSICTIDAFCLALLREFPLEADLDPSFEVADEIEVARLLESALDESLRVGRALATRDPDLAMLLGYFPTGRLRQGLRHLLDRRHVAPAALARFLRAVPPDLTGETASLRAAATLRGVLAGLPGGVAGFLADGPRDEAAFGVLANDLRALSAGRLTTGAAVRAALDALSAYLLKKTGAPRRYPPRYRQADAPSLAAWRRHAAAFSQLAAAAAEIAPRHARDVNAVLARGVARLYAVARDHYRRGLAREDVLDFAEALHRAVELLRQMDEFAQSRYRLESRYHHLLVDEFQDTSRLQWELVALLVQSWGEGSGLVHEAPLPPSIFIVGDRKQSIYRFRDAEVSVLEDASRFVAALRPGGASPRRAISHSFRARPELLAFVNAVFGTLERRPGRADAFRFEDDDRFPIMSTAQPDDPETPPDRVGVPGSRDPSVGDTTGTAHQRRSDPGEGTRVVPMHGGPGDPPLGLVVGEREADMAAALADEVMRWLGSGVVRDPQTGVRRAARPGDIGILFRARASHQAIGAALATRGVPTYVYKGLGFFDTGEVLDLTALIGWLAEPGSSLRAAAFLRSRFLRVSDRALLRLGPDLASVLTSPAEPPGWDRLDDEDRRVLSVARDAVPGWLALVDRLPPAEVVDRVIAGTAYDEELAGPTQVQARENVKKIRGLVRRLQNRGYATMHRVARQLEGLSAGDESNAVVDAVDAVNLMTVHAAKGLEFPVVFVAHLGRGTGTGLAPVRVVLDADGSEPAVAIGSFTSTADEEEAAREREETKRLLYVALTRARDALYLCALLPGGRFAPSRGSLGEVLPDALRERLDAAIGAPPGTADLVWEAPPGPHRFRVCR